jgi:hypothetical protein
MFHAPLPMGAPFTPIDPAILRGLHDETRLDRRLAGSRHAGYVRNVFLKRRFFSASPKEASALAKLVYIGGYGRSGSTLLEYLLATNSDVVACGEVGRHLLRFRARRTCTCGRCARKCPVWGPFQLGPQRFEGWDHERLSLALLERISRKFAVMVDSSKTAWGSWSIPFRLRRRLGKDFLLIHLVRDPRAVCWSTIRTPISGKKAKKASTRVGRCLRTAVGWNAANIVCEMYGRLHPEQYMQLRYEDLTHSAADVLDHVFGRISQPPRQRKRDNRHQLYGNRMRLKPLSLPELQEDTAWKSAMPQAYRLIAAALCWPLSAKYGYFSR